MKFKCKPTNVWFSDPQPENFFRQKWSADAGVQPWYLCYKVLLCLFFLSSIVYTWVQDHEHHGHTENSWKYVIWMTSWGICLFCGALLLETVITVVVFMKWNLFSRMLLFSWAYTTMAYTMAVLITLMYWALLYHWDEPPTYANIFVHGLQGVFAIIDQTIANRPWHLFKLWSSLPIPVVYLTFNIIYWAAGGTNNDGDDWVYPVLKWGEAPGFAVLVMLMATVALPVIHMVFSAITLGRDRMHRRVFAAKTPVGSDNS